MYECHCDSLPFQFVGQCRKGKAAGQRFFDRLVNRVLHFVWVVQFLGLYVLLTLGERQGVFLLHGLADSHAPDSLVMAPHQLRIVLYPVIEDMQVGMLRIGMPYYHILRIGYSHTLHILACEFGHKSVRESRRILRVKRERNMAYDLCLFGPGLALEIETADHIPYTPGIYSVAVEHTGMAALFEQVAHGPAERFTRYDLSYHSSLLFSFSLFKS